METPICDFVRSYAAGQTMRLHMPGHKGSGPLGCEELDITEICGADSLYEADGIIAKSEANASLLFGCPTFYSTEGSSQCIRAMVYLALLHAKGQGRGRRLAAGRNAHKTFLSAAALMDAEVDWLYPNEWEAYLSCSITAQSLEEYFQSCGDLPAAVYVTSPNYLGNILPIAELAQVCHRYGTLLLVDNAHGAYLKFLPNSRHPMDLGADLCCDSAHKTLPVLTGGAYLHIRDAALANQAKNALALFGSTSPSYLILQSLDAANAVLSDPTYIQKMVELSFRADGLRQQLGELGINANCGNEPLKITVYPRFYGYTGTEMADHLRANGIECEFSDPDFLVLMLTPAIEEKDLQRLYEVLSKLSKREAVLGQPPRIGKPQQKMTIRQAAFSPSEVLPIDECEGKILAAATVGCPPAVPIVVCGERIDANAIECMRYYAIQSCCVVKNEV